MSLTEVLQVVSVVAAAIAALGSWRAAAVTSKQYKLQQSEKIKKYRPIFKIKRVDNNPSGYLFTIVNEGFPAFAVNYVNWDGEGVVVKEFFNGEMRISETKMGKTSDIERYESLIIVIEVQDRSTTEGFIEINGYDIEHNDFSFKTPLIQIENGEITNGIKLTYQNLI